MTTRAYAAVVDHTSDAGFRAWGSTLSSNLATAGLIQTADTGQINWATVTRPAVNIAAGYEIWRLANSSLFFKIEYGTGSSAANVPQMWITVGTGSNGSGTLSGQVSTRSIWTVNQSPSSTAAAYNTYICVTADCLNICWSLNGFLTNSTPGGFLSVGPTVDSNGAVTTTGYSVVRQSTGAGFAMQCVRVSSPASSYSESTAFSLVPGAVTSSIVVNGNNQAYTWWSNVPDVQPYLYGCTYLNVEIAKGNTFSVAVVGTTAHAYLAIGQISSSGPAFGGSNAAAMLYE